MFSNNNIKYIKNNYILIIILLIIFIYLYIYIKKIDNQNIIDNNNRINNTNEIDKNQNELNNNNNKLDDQNNIIKNKINIIIKSDNIKEEKSNKITEETVDIKTKIKRIAEFYDDNTLINLLKKNVDNIYNLMPKKVIEMKILNEKTDMELDMYKLLFQVR